MAKRVQVDFIDDIDGANAASTVTFGLDGTTYQIDLSEDDQVAMRESLARYIEHGRRTAGTLVKPTRASSLRKADLDAMRQWARAHGHDVSDRGRIAGTIQAEYRKAHRDAS